MLDLRRNPVSHQKLRTSGAGVYRRNRRMYWLTTQERNVQHTVAGVPTQPSKDRSHLFANGAAESRGLFHNLGLRRVDEHHRYHWTGRTRPLQASGEDIAFAP